MKLNVLKFFKKDKSISYSDLSSKEKKNIISGAVQKANEEQAEVVKNYGNIKRCNI